MPEPKPNIQFCIDTKEKESLIKQRLKAFKTTFNRDRSEYLRTYFRWRLRRVVGKRETKLLVIGEFVYPNLVTRELNEKMTAKYVVEQLNLKTTFDFEYQPIDGDEITIDEVYEYMEIIQFSRPEIGGVLQFAFEENEWHFGYVPEEEYESVEIKRGRIENLP